MTEKSILFHHNNDEKYIQIKNYKYDLIFNITIQIEMEFKYIFNDTFNYKLISERQDIDILVKP